MASSPPAPALTPVHTPGPRSKSMEDITRIYDENSPRTIPAYIGKMRELLLTIDQDKKSTISPSSSNALKYLSKLLTKIDLLAHKLGKDLDTKSDLCITLEERHSATKEAYRDVMASIPRTTDIASIIESTIKNLINQDSNSTSDNTSRNDEATETTTSEPLLDQTQKSPNQKSKMISNADLHSDPSLQYRRTLIVKSKSFLSGRGICKVMDTSRITTHAIVEHILVSRNKVDYICASETDRDQLLNDLNNSSLSESLIFLKEQPTLQKMILLSVPSNMDFNYIESSISHNFLLAPDELQLLKSKPSRSDGFLDHIILMPLSLARTIRAEGGVILGASLHRLQPFTTLLRCNNCQTLGHGARNCGSLFQICVNCGQQVTDSHDPQSCRNQPACYNCLAYNKKNNSFYDTNHKASFSNCPAFRLAFSQQKDKINSLFETPNPNVSKPTLSSQSTTSQQHSQSKSSTSSYASKVQDSATTSSSNVTNKTTTKKPSPNYVKLPLNTNTSPSTSATASAPTTASENIWSSLPSNLQQPFLFPFYHPAMHHFHPNIAPPMVNSSISTGRSGLPLYDLSGDDSSK